MAIDETTRELISLKKLSGKAHTSNDKGLPNEAKPSGLTLSSETVFGETVPNVATKTLYNISGGTVEYLRLSASFIQGSDTSDGRHGFELKLPDDYQAQSSNPLKGTYPFINGQSIQVTSGALQLIPPSFATLYEATPYHSASSVQTQIPVLDARDWYLDYFNGVFFQQDPPGSGDHAQNPKYVDAFLYVGDYLSKVVSNTGGGDPGAQYITLAATSSLQNERVLNPGAGLTITDGGAGNAVTLGLDNDIVATISGSTFTGAISAPAFSGSLHHLSDGRSYLVAGTGIAISSASNGQVTITGNVGDITGVTAGTGLTGGGTDGTVTLRINDDQIATVTGSNTFAAKQIFSAGLSGSLSQLTNGTSYLVAGNNVTITTASSGQVTITSTDTNTVYTAGNGLDLIGNAFSVDLKSSGGLRIASTELAIDDNVIATVTGSNTFTAAQKFNAGLSGSITQLTDGKSYLVAGSGIAIASASNGQITITGNVGDITGVTAGTGMTGGGTSGTVTLNVDTSVVAALAGATFTGATNHNLGLSGSLTQLTNGKSYLVAGAGISIASASNGQVTITGNVGDITGVAAGTGLTGGGTSGDVTLRINDSQIATVTGSNTFVPVQKFNAGLSGSLTQLTNGTSYLVAGSGISIASASNGQVTITGNVGDITGVAAGTGLTGGGTSGDVTLRINDSQVATVTGSNTFVPVQKFNAGLSGSLTQLTNGTSYLVGGTNVTIASATNGQITVSSTDTNTQYTAGAGLSLGGTQFTVDTSAVAMRAGTTFTGDVDFKQDIRVSGTLHVYELKSTLVSSSIIFKSGSTKFGDTTDDLHAFTGSVEFLNPTKAFAGLSGSLTQLTNGTSYLVGGANVTIASASSGQITISSTDTNTQYTAGDGLDLSGTSFSVDLKSAGGLKIDATEMAVDDRFVATLTGSQFSGNVGVTGSLGALGTGNQLELMYNTSNSATFAVDSGGDLTITPSGGDLTVKGDFIVRDESEDKIIAQIFDNADDGVIAGYANNTITTLIHANGTSYFKGGNVGIGTSSPDELLDVRGNIQSTGYVSASLGFSGSLTNLVDGRSYIAAGANVTITSASNGQITISSTGGSGTALTAVSGSVSVSNIDNINYTNLAIVQNLSSGDIALTGTIGAAEDGNYADGLYTDFTTSTTVGTAVDRFNEVLKALAPPPADALDDIDINVDGTDVSLSFGSSNDQSSASPAYASVAASAGIGAAVDVNGVYQTATSGNNLRAAVFNGSQAITGDLNEDVAVNQQGSETNYPANSFGDADDGVLRLEVNGATIHEIDLTVGSVGAGDSGAGSDTEVNGNGSGFTNLSAATNGTFENGNTFASFKHRTGRYNVATGDQRRGWNYARVLHVRSGSTLETNYVEWVNDDNANALAAAGNGITYAGSGLKTLSGVRYYTGGTVTYQTRVTNAYKYVYDTADITFGTSIGGSTNSGASYSLSAQSKPAIAGGEDHTKTLHLTGSAALSSNYMVAGTVTANVNVSHPLKSNLSSGGSSTVSNILMYSLSDTSSTTSETFQAETYRLQSGSFNTQASITGGSNDWDSTIHMSGSGGHADGLLFYIGTLAKPQVDWRYANGPSPSNPDYSGVPDGLRTFYRKFRNTTGRAVNNLRWVTSGGTTSLVAEGTSIGTNNKIRVFFKHPGTTEWLDARTAFSYNDVSNRAGGAAPAGGAGDSSLASATNYISFGTASIPNNDWVMMKVEADDDWTGNLDTVTVTFGAEGAINVAPDLSQIDANNSGVDGSLSFGSSLALAGYTNVTTTAGGSATNANGDFDLSGIRRGVFDGTVDITGDLNEQVSASGNNYPANAFGGGNAHTGTLKLEVNGSVIHTFDLNNSFAANSDTSGAGNSRFNISAASVSRDSNEIPEWTRRYRTGTWLVKAANQRKGHNYARVTHEVTGSSETSTYVEWVNDTDGAAATLTVAGGAIVNFRGTTEYAQSGIKYFVTPKADFVVTGSNVYKYIYSENSNAINFPTSTNCSIVSVHVSGSGVVNGSAGSSTMALPNLDTSIVAAYDHRIYVTGTLNFGQASSIPGGTSYTMAASARIHHPHHGNTTSSTTTSDTLLVFTSTDNSTQLVESFNGEAKRLISGSYATQASVVAGGNAWDSTISMNGGNAGHNTGLAVYNGKLVAPANTGNSGDFRSRTDGGTLAAPSGNPNYSSVSNSTRHYTRWFQNTSGGSKTDFSITINGAGTIVTAGTSLSGGNNLRVHAKIPETSSGFSTGWMDLAAAFQTGQNGDDAGCLVGSLDSSLNATNNATFGTQSVGASEYILVRIVADKTWTGDIEDITISWS